MLREKLKYRIKAYFQKRRDKKILLERRNKLEKYIENGMKPWSPGYSEYKEDFIIKSISDKGTLEKFDKNKILDFGKGIDERVIEYPWLFSKINSIQSSTKLSILDAGSTFNFEYLLNHELLAKQNLTIYTYYPENLCFWKKRISYVYGDLRILPFQNNWYDIVICQSTLEHIDMDNSIYGYDLKSISKDSSKKSVEYLKVINELVRVTKNGGMVLITVPYGKFENHGFFQQFDSEMLQSMLDIFKEFGRTEISYMKYEISGWRYAEKSEVDESISYNPHSGLGKLNDGAAHSRAVALLQFIKN